MATTKGDIIKGSRVTFCFVWLLNYKQEKRLMERIEASDLKVERIYIEAKLLYESLVHV